MIMIGTIFQAISLTNVNLNKKPKNLKLINKNIRYINNQIKKFQSFLIKFFIKQI